MTTCSNCGTEVEPGRGFLIPAKDKKAPSLHLCAECAGKLDAATEAETQNPTLLLAVLLGLVAAAVACLIWYAIIVVTKYELGIVAIAVGWLVGTAVMVGAGRKRGLVLQIIAVIITLIALVCSEYLIVRYFVVQNLEAEGYTGLPLLFAPSVMLGLIVEGIKISPISLLFWAIALWQAFVVPAKRLLRRVPV